MKIHNFQAIAITLAFLTILKAKLGATTTTLLHRVATPGVLRTNPRESHGDGTAGNSHLEHPKTL